MHYTVLCKVKLLQGHPTCNVIFEFDISGTHTVATMDFDTSNFSEHVDISLFGK